MLTCLAPPEPALAVAEPTEPSPDAGTAELLHRLRGDLSERPRADPGLAGGLREWLADELAPLTNVLERPLVVTRRMLAVGDTGVRAQPGPAEPGLVRAALIGMVFRQRIAGSDGQDPMAEAVAGLEADGFSGQVVSGLAALRASERRMLGREVAEISERITRHWTPVPAAWLPRTRERLSVPIGGRLVLTGVADLVLGRPAERASVCVVSLRTGPPRPVDRSVRHLLALLETVRSGRQPFRVASYYASTGHLEMEDVTEELLTGTVTSLIDRTLTLGLGRPAA